VPEHEAKGSEQELVSRYFLTHYVTLRERYFYALAESDYQEVGAFNSPQLNQDWMGLWDAIVRSPGESLQGRHDRFECK